MKEECKAMEMLEIQKLAADEEASIELPQKNETSKAERRRARGSSSKAQTQGNIAHTYAGEVEVEDDEITSETNEKDKKSPEPPKKKKKKQHYIE